VPRAEVNGVVATLADNDRRARVIGELVAGTGAVVYRESGGGEAGL